MIRVVIALFLSLFCGVVHAGPRRGIGVVPTNLATAHTLIGEGDINGNSNAFINMMKWATSASLPSGATTSIATLTDANGFPAGPLTTSTAMSYSLGQFPIPRYGETQVTRWPGKGGGIFTNTGMTFTIISATPSIATCIFGGTGPFTDSIKFSGTGCYVKWSASPTSGANPAGFGMSWSFTNSFGQITAYDGTMTALEIYPFKYEANRDLCQTDLKECFDPDYLTLMRSLNPNILRTMDWAHPNFSNVTSNAFKMPTTYVGYNSQIYPANLWGGDTAGTSPAFTVGAAPSTPVSYTDGETISVRFTAVPPASTVLVSPGAVNNGGAIQISVASTAAFTNGQRIAFSGYTSATGTGFGVGYYTVQIDSGTQITLVGSVWPSQTWASGSNPVQAVSIATIDIGTRGPKLLVNNGSGPIGSLSWGSAPAGAMSTLVYDGWLDVVYVTNSSPTSGAVSNGGLVASWPIEVIVALANKLHVNLWYNFPLTYDQPSISATAQYVRDNLSPDLKAYFECSNEVWNFLFPQTLQAQLRGLYLGFPYSSGRAEGGYAAYCVRQMGATARTAWSSRSLSTLQIVNALSAASAAQTTTASNQLDGRDLASVANGGSGNANWISQTGNANYTTTGNRPVDYSDVMSYATYWNGIAIGVGSSSQGGLAITFNAKEKAAFQTAVNAFNAGTLNTGYQWFDSDLRQGTTNTQDVASTSGGDTFNITSHGFTANSAVVLTTSGTLPTGLSLNLIYRPIIINANSFKLGTVAAATTPVTFTGGSGTISIGQVGGSTLLWLNSFVYGSNPLGGSNPGYEAIAASYDSYRAGAGKNPLRIIPYEGGYQGQAPTLNQLNTNGLTSSATVTFNIGSSPGVNWTAHPFHNGDLISFSGGTLPSNVASYNASGNGSGTVYFVTNASTNGFDISVSYNMPVAPFAITLTGSPSGTTTGLGSPYSINVLMEGWKNSATWGGQFVTDTYSLFKAIPPGAATNHSTIYGWFALQGFSQWSLQPGNSFSTPYATFNALQTINH